MYDGVFKVMEQFNYNCGGRYRAFYVCHDSELYAQKYDMPKIIHIIHLCELK